MSAPTIAFFCMGAPGHAQRLRALIAATVAAGMDAVVFTSRDQHARVRTLGARFVDLFEGRPLATADDASSPLPCRYVSFAGHFGDDVIDAARRARPRIVVADSFAVIGRVVARGLGVPWVNVCAGHNVHPSQYLEVLAGHPVVDVGDRCLEAVDRLRERFGLSDASPFSYVAPASESLNIYCEPREYLTPEERARFEPVAFFGSLPWDCRSAEAPSTGDRFFPDADCRIYVSFGTMIWSTRQNEAVAAFEAIGAAVMDRKHTHALIGLGGRELDERLIDQLASPRVRVLRWADQWQALRHCDVFITHHGLNATHEAVWRTVPMLSYPFVWDQPPLARRSQELGLALPIVTEPMAPLDPPTVTAALDELASRRAELDHALKRARRWEEDVLDGRDEVIQRMAQLA